MSNFLIILYATLFVTLNLIPQFIFAKTSPAEQKSIPGNSEKKFITNILLQLEVGKTISENLTDPIYKKFQLLSQDKKSGNKQWLNSWNFKTFQYPIFLETIPMNGKDIISGYSLTFPSYFMHDFIHQELIQKFGQQTFYKRINNSGIYIWRNFKLQNTELKITYEANCSITCFPVFLSITEANKNNFFWITK